MWPGLLGDCGERVREQFLRTLVDYVFDAIAYCFMRDYLHALVEATSPDCDFAKFVSMFKQRSAFAHKQATGEKLWQESYFDRVLRRDESTLVVVEYILDNPVKAGYCQDPREYSHLGSTRYSIEELLEAVASHRGRP
jgi:putative transposase